MNLEIDVSLSYSNDNESIQSLQGFLSSNELIKPLLKNGNINHPECTYLDIQINAESIQLFNYTIQVGKTLIQDQELYITKDTEHFNEIRKQLLEYITNNLMFAGG